MHKMDNNFYNLINEVLEAVDTDPTNELTELKVESVLEIINELVDLPPYLFAITTFLLGIAPYEKNPKLLNLYNMVTRKIASFLIAYNYFPLTESSVRDYYDPNLANAIAPLNETHTNVHKSGDIIHFIEHKYTDATGRKFVSITVPNYDEHSSLLQVRLHEQLQSE